MTSNAWHFGKEPPPFKTLVCAVRAVDQLYDWLYFIAYYVPDSRTFYDPCERIAYAYNVVAGWRLFTENLEGVVVEVKKESRV